MAHDPYENPFLYGFAPWPLDHEDVTTTGTTVDPYTDFYAGVSEPPMGGDPTIPAVTYEGAVDREVPIETYAGSVAPADTIENIVSAGADTTIEPLIGLSDPTNVQYRDLMSRINQSRTTLGTDIPMNLAGASLTSPLVPQNIEALPPVYDAEQAWLEDMGLVGPYEKMSEFVSGFTTDDEEEELKMTMRDKFQAWLKKGSQATKKALQKAADVVAPNFGLNRGELTGTGPGGGYTDSQVDFMMMNALGKQAVDEGLFVSGYDYKNTSSGVQDPFNYNVYASNYQEEGSASYETWKNIVGSKAYKHANPAKTVAEAIAKETVGRDITPVAPSIISVGGMYPGGQHEGGGGQTPGQRDTARAQRDDPGMGGHKKGGLIRKKYGNGGIVDLL